MRILPAFIGVAAFIPTVMAVSQAPTGGEIKFQSREGARTSLVELYTSEGCSSCPPAEAWLSRLTTSPKLWTEIVPVAFHVDYWDNSRWRDRFASRAWTPRQREYAAHWGSDTVYTPGFVLDGREWPDWASFSERSLPAAGATKEGAGQLSVAVKNSKTALVVYPTADRPGAAREVSVALLGFDLNSNVKGGENSGRSLRHDFVALACEKKESSTDRSEASISIELPSPPPDAKRVALGVWVEEPGHAGIQQAAGGWLTNVSERTR